MFPWVLTPWPPLLTTELLSSGEGEILLVFSLPNICLGDTKCTVSEAGGEV